MEVEEVRDESEERAVRAAAASASSRRRGHQRRRSSISREHTALELARLPLLREAASEEEATRLFRAKLQMCRTLFPLEDLQASYEEGPLLKRNTLVELIEYINLERNQRIFNSEGVMEDVVAMVSSNVFRTLAPQLEAFDPDEDEPVLESSWPHLQAVYEFLLRFVVSKEVDPKVARKKGIIDQTFCLKLLQIFDSEDPRERDYLKTILHRVYGKFTTHRAYIRKQISFTFQRFAFETQRHNGIGELLEILGSIINGFALPLKTEHLRFLRTSLIPLHRAASVVHFHHQLTYCIIQYLEKDASTLIPIVKGLVQAWPWHQSTKQVLFLNELEDILETAASEFVPQILPYVMKILTRSLESEHFQLLERTLYLWNSDNIATNVLGSAHAQYVLPKLFDSLVDKEAHWNSTVRNITEEVIRLIQTRVDRALWDKLQRETEQRKEAKKEVERKRDALFAALDESEANYEMMGCQDDVPALLSPPQTSLAMEEEDLVPPFQETLSLNKN